MERARKGVPTDGWGFKEEPSGHAAAWCWKSSQEQGWVVGEGHVRQALFPLLSGRHLCVRKSRRVEGVPLE